MRHPSRSHTLVTAGVLLWVLSLCFSLTALAVGSAPAVEGVSPRFRFSVDESNVTGLKGTSGELLTVCRNAELSLGESLTLSGWLSTERGVSAYRFMWLPAGGGQAVWQDIPAEQMEITSRKDLAGAGIPYASGHGTAGYRLTVPTPTGLADGYYDVYLRALDGDGAPCDFLALIHLRYGNADTDDGTARTVNWDRLAAEVQADPTVLQNGAEVRAEGLYLPSGGWARLGELSLGGYESVEVEYRTVSGKPLSVTERHAVLGLKRRDVYPFVVAGQEGYQLTDTLAYALPRDASGTLSLDLTARTESGAVWLTGSFSEPILVTGITFYRNGGGTDRVAARLYLSEVLYPTYFTGQNAVDLAGVKDPVLGDVLRMEVSEDTNDPYVHFHAEQVLETADIRLSADNYKYMVVWARALPHNHGQRMTFYLCAGTITGATEACTHTFTTVTDGQWHAYLLDLSQNANWKGVIHGWRFDIISGNCRAGDAVEFASVQFFRTLDAATTAARAPLTELTPYQTSDPAVYADLVEEQDGAQTLDPAETYLVTEPETPPDTEPPETESGTDTEAEPSPETQAETPPTAQAGSETPLDTSSKDPVEETAPASKGGCGSVLPMVTLLLLPTSAYALCRRRASSRA